MSFTTHVTDTRAPGARTSRVLTSLREAIRRHRTERTDKRHVARAIAAYPATRSAALAVLPHRDAA